MIAALLLATTLATGVQLDPVGRTIDAGNFPLTMTLTPERDRVVLVLSGYRTSGIQVVDLAAGNVVQDIPLNSAFIGAAFSPDGKTLYVSGGFDDVVHVYSWADKRATFVRDLNLRVGDKKGESISVERWGRSYCWSWNWFPFPTQRARWRRLKLPFQ